MNSQFVIAFSLLICAFLFGIVAIALMNTTPNPSSPVTPLTGNLIVQANVNLSFNTNEGFNVQDIAQNIFVNFTVPSGTLDGLGNLNATSDGGTMIISPTTDGTLSITSNTPFFYLYINDGLNPAPYTFSSGISFTIDWRYHN